MISAAAPSTSLTLRATVSRITFENTATGYQIARLDGDASWVGDSATLPEYLSTPAPGSVKGSFPFTLQPETTYIFTGSRIIPANSRYPSTFIADSARRSIPRDPTGVARYLQRHAPHVGLATSKRIVEAFGPESAISICRTNPDLLASTIPGITPDRASLISAHLTSLQAMEDAEVDLRALFEAVRFPNNILVACLRRWGESAPEVVRNDPYALIEQIRGVSWLRADDLAQTAVGIAPNDPARLRAAALHWLSVHEQQQGHTTALRTTAHDGIRDLLGVTRDSVLVTGDQIEETISSELVEWIDPDAGPDRPEVQRPATAEAESFIASFLAHAHAPAGSQANDANEDDLSVAPIVASLNDLQAEAVYTAAFRRRIMLLTGGPGTGKSHTTRAIVDALQALDRAYNPDHACGTIALLAPTGKAARRLSEATGRPASTIHRALRLGKTDDLATAAGGSAGDPLSADTVLVDEVSMVDVHLLATLLRSIRATARLILVGDPDQLPSVGPGQCLRDLLPHLPRVHLTQIMRTDAPEIIQLCEGIRRGQLHHGCLMNHSGSTVKFIDCSNLTMPVAALSLARAVFERMTANPRALGFSVIDPVRDVQMLAPTNAACDLINEWVQTVRWGRTGRPAKATTTDEDDGPPGPDDDSSSRKPPLKPLPGDKVIQTKNDYSLGIYNGDIGYVTSILDKTGEVLVQFEEPDGSQRTVRFPRDNDLRVAYAITIHKAQGAEAPIVAILLHRDMRFMLSRNLIYTAVSRAKRICVIMGDRDAMQKALHKEVRRMTTLGRRLEMARVSAQKETA